MNEVLLAPNDKIPFEDSRIRYPVLVSPKMDGHRCITLKGELFSRNGKLHPNMMLRERFRGLLKLAEQGWIFDGELYDHGLSFQQIQSMIRTGYAPLSDTLHFAVFDCLTVDEWEHGTEPPFENRIERLRALGVEFQAAFEWISIIPQYEADTPAVARNFFERFVEDGYEGAMVRDPQGHYKHGRATLNQGLMFKFKQWATVDAVITGFEQRRRMKGEVATGLRERDMFGHLTRSGKDEDYETIDEIGSVTVQLANGTSTGVGFAKDFDGRVRFTWENRYQWIGKHVEIRYMPVGTKDRPRFGFIITMRPDLDIEKG